MSFTNLATVKKHLLSTDIGSQRVECVPITLNAEDDSILPDQNLVQYSEIVKWETTLPPTNEGPITMSDNGKMSLSAGNVVRGSVVVTLSETLSTVYVEEADYQLDYSSGALRRVPTGGIPNNQPVYVYYNKYSTFHPGSDYDMDYVRGTIRRRSGSSIPDKARVLVDYMRATGSVTDDLISQAIVEAEDLIVRSLSAAYSSSSTDQGLQTGATLLTLSIVARDMTAENLGRRVTSDSGGRAKEWQNLSTLYEARAWETLRPFLESCPVHSPERRTNA